MKSLVTRTGRLVIGAALLGATLVGLGQPALAEGEATAWSATPTTDEGAPDGRIRYELEAAPGAEVLDRVLVTNSSTVERTFRVYGADGFNTATGGYDLEPAATAPTDVGSWVTVESSEVTIPALSEAVVAFTVEVPAGAAPGDHPGGIVVSVVDANLPESGVIVDTRVAVRLNVRVAGEVSAALEVRSVNASYGFTGVPFAGAPTTVTYEVVNTGNVKVIGTPRLRLVGPFGITIAELEPEELREVLPGDSFTVTSVLEGVAPAVVLTAVVDVTMAAAPGPATEVPLVSSTGRSMVVAISWTGLLLVIALGVAVWVLVRRRRLRRLHGEREWDRALDAARRGGGDVVGVAGAGPAGGPSVGAVLTLVLALGGAAILLPAPAAQAADDDLLNLTIPASPATATPAPTAPTAPTTTRRPSASFGSSSGGGGSAVPVPETVVEPVADVADDGEATAAGDGPAPDLQWVEQGRGWGAAQWGLVGLGATGAAAGLGFAGRALIIGRRGAGAA